jgi:hypothetical protein
LIWQSRQRLCHGEIIRRLAGFFNSTKNEENDGQDTEFHDSFSGFRLAQAQLEPKAWRASQERLFACSEPVFQEFSDHFTRIDQAMEGEREASTKLYVATQRLRTARREEFAKHQRVHVDANLNFIIAHQCLINELAMLMQERFCRIQPVIGQLYASLMEYHAATAKAFQTVHIPDSGGEGVDIQKRIQMANGNLQVGPTFMYGEKRTNVSHVGCFLLHTHSNCNIV